MRSPAAEKLEIIRLFEQSHLPVRATLGKLGITRSTFHRWYDAYQSGGPEALSAWPAPIRWFTAEFGGSRSEEEASAQEVELGAAVHGALEELEAVDLPLGLSAAPGQAKAGTNSGCILSEGDGEALDHPHTAGTGVGQPSVEGGGDAGHGQPAAAAAADDPTEPSAEVDDPGSLVILQHARDHSSSFGIEIVRLAQEMPRQLLR